MFRARSGSSGQAGAQGASTRSKHRLAVEDVDGGIGGLAMHAERQPDRRHRSAPA